MPAWPVRPAAVEGLTGETDAAPVYPPPMHDPADDMADAALVVFNAPADRVISAGGPHEDRLVRIVRWLTGACLAVALHVGLFVAVTSHAHETPVEADGSPLTVDIVDMSSLPATPPTDIAPGPETSASEAQDASPPVIQPPPQETAPAPAPPSEAPPLPSPPTPEPEASPKQPDPVPVAPVPPPPPEPVAQPADASNASVDSAPPPSSTRGDQDTTTHAGDHQTAGAAELSRWQSSLVAHIEGFRRYPKGAHGHGGTVVVGFELDLSGHVVAVRVVTSSGSTAIDAEAIATVRRADPFPAPPAGGDVHALTFTLPIHFQAR